MSDKLAVVTGGTKGIGKAIVEKFLSENYRVVTCARSIDSTGSEASERLLVKAVDMSAKIEVMAFAEFIRSIGSGVDVLVNNVGVFLPGNIVDEAEGQLEKQIETNLYSAYYLTRELLPLMNAGFIFNICSTASIAPYANGSSYSITKYALLGFSHNLREELKDQGIRVTAILPGNTLTPSWGETDLPEEKFIKASDVADTVFGLTTLSSNTDVEQVLIQPQHKT